MTSAPSTPTRPRTTARDSACEGGFAMGCIGKTVVRGAVLTALVGGVAVAVAGPETVRALFHQTRHNVRHAIDAQISDLVALRAQLRSLEEQYPKKIADVRGDLAELNEQIAQIERDLAV